MGLIHIKRFCIKLFFLFIVFFFPLLSLGQPQKNQNTKDVRKLFSKADSYIESENYIDALRLFLVIDSLTPNNQNIQFYLGLCYLYSNNDKLKAQPFLEKAVTNISKKYLGSYKDLAAPNFAWYFLAKSYFINKEYDKAKDGYKNFMSYYYLKRDSVFVKEAQRQIINCNYAKKQAEKPLNILVQNLGDAINSEYPEYAAVISNDNKIYFTSRRPTNTGKQKDHTGQFTEDIYVSELSLIDSTWQKAQNIGTNFNSKANEATMSLSYDQQNLLTYLDQHRNGNIFIRYRDNNNSSWTKPQKLPRPINTLYWETHACLSPDGKTMYFVSNRRKGIGGRDIWQSTKKEKGKWGKPINLGPSINTPFEEESPFISADNKTLFFSSQGHDNMGGFDVFMNVKQNNGTWLENPINLGNPINTPDDNVFFYPSKNGTSAFYSSNSIDGIGNQDIYRVSVVNDTITNLYKYLYCTFINDSMCKPIEIPIVATKNTTNIDTTFLVIVEKNDTSKSKNNQLITELIPEKSTTTNNTNNKADNTLPDSNNEKPKKNIPTEPEIIKNNAQETNYKPLEGTCFTVQVGAGKLKMEYFEPIKDIVRVIECPDGMRRYVTKEFSTKDEARAYRTQMIDLGYSDAWVRECLRIEDFVVGNEIKLDNIFFDYAQTKIRQDSYEELEKLYKYMIENPNAKLLISGHSDNIGSFWYNKKLSEERAKSVMNYLLAKNISKDRMSYQGFGFKLPISDNSTEDGRRKNRRTEFKIIKK